MTRRSPIMIKQQAVDGLLENTAYREGVLLSAANISPQTARLTVIDKETNEYYSIKSSSLPSILGSCKKYIHPEVYESINPSNPAQIAEKILDTRTSGLRFYYFEPAARKM